MQWLADLVLQGAVIISITMAMMGLLLATLRLVRGPSLPDRVVALDLIATLSVGVIVGYDIYTEQPALLDAAIIVALIAFLGTVAFASYLERRGRDE